MGGGAPVPWGRRHWVGIHFCRHPEVVKLQQQCHMQNTIFDLPHTTGSVLFFSGRGRVPIYPGDSNRRIGRKNENDNPVRVVYMFFNHYINLWVFHDIQGFRHVPGETGTTCKKAVFILLFSREIQGIKWKNGNFLI